MSVEADTLIANPVAKDASSNDRIDAPAKNSSPDFTQTAQTDSPALTSRSDSDIQQNKAPFIKAHRRGASYIPGGYNFSPNNSKMPLAKSKIEELGNAFPAKKIEVASLAIKSAAQRSSVLNVERSISSPLPTVSSYMMRPPASRWRSTNGIHDADLHRSNFGQYGRPPLSKANQERLSINTIKPTPKPVKQDDTEENSRRKTVTWCELTEVHEFVNADSQKANKSEEDDQKGQVGNSFNSSSNEKLPSSQKHSTEVFVKNHDFEETVPSLDMDKLEIVTPLHMSKCVDTDSDISLSSPSSEDSMPFTDAPETQDIVMTPETNTYRRNSRISRDDVLSRLAELKKNRNEDDAIEANNLGKEKSLRSENEKLDTIATNTLADMATEAPKGNSNFLPEITHLESSSATWAIPSMDSESAIKTSDSSNEIASITDSVVTESFIDSDSLQSDGQSVDVATEPPSSYVSNMGKSASAQRLDLSEWYKQKKRMERKQQEHHLSGSYDFDASYSNGNESSGSTPARLDEKKRRATYTEGISNISLNSNRQSGGSFEEQLLEEFDRIAGGQKPKTYRERTRSKVVVASADFEKAGGADQAVADALATKANIRTQTPEVYDDTANSIHSIESTANFAPRPWAERRPSTDLLSQMMPDSASCGRLYVKVIAAQDLDFPFPSRDMEARCVLNEGTYEHMSPASPLSRNTEFGHEFKLETHDFLDFTITIHVNTPDRSTAFSRILSTQRKVRAEGLSKYINSEDGALAQVRISFQDIMSECKSKICTATFHLVNGWYKDSTSPLLASRNRSARRPTREKVVGKLLVKLVYLPGVDPKKYSLPPSLGACEEALNIRRWHETCWHVGYMSQQGGDLNFWRRRFYKAVGARLYSHTDTHHSLRTIIDLSKAEIMTVGHEIVANSQEPHVLEMIEQLPPLDNDLTPPIRPASVNSSRISISSEIRRNSKVNLDGDRLYCAVKNSMRITFSNGDHIDFFCDSASERKQWVDVLKNIVGRVPEWPEWLTEGRQVIDF